MHSAHGRARIDVICCPSQNPHLGGWSWSYRTFDCCKLRLCLPKSCTSQGRRIRLHITQSALSKQISKLEDEIGFQLFIHNHQVVEITEAGRVFVEEAREVVFHAERAVLIGRAIANGADEVVNFGKSAYTDPFLVSTLLTVHLPLFPNMKVKLWSNFSNDLVQQVVAGSIDVAVVTGVPDNSKLRLETIADNPFYIVMSMQDELTRHLRCASNISNRNWILLGQHANPYLYDMIQTVASEQGVRPSEIHPFTSPDEASELIREYQGLAFLPKLLHGGLQGRYHYATVSRRSASS